MKAFVDHWGNHQPTPTVVVSEGGKSSRVTYRNDAGQRFRVVVHQRENPIGFRAQLPGDKPSK